MSDGVIIGGIEYLYAAYGITWFSLAIYAGTLLWRTRRAKQDMPPASASSSTEREVL